MDTALQTMPNSLADKRWAAVVARDAEADGRFVFAVKTTGIYCRPSCPSRHAKRENVRFYEDATDAQADGFRACLRCKPDGASPAKVRAEAIAKACRLIEEAEELPSLERLAKAVGMSPYHFHRQFKAVTGVTPHAYGAAMRAERLREHLAGGKRDVTEALYEAGYNASSRLYESSNAILGMTPSAYRKGGVDAEIRFAIGTCSLGAILVAQSAKGICAILLGDDPEVLLKDLQDRFPKATLVGGDTAFEKTVAQVIAFVDAPRIGLDLPLDLQGTAFQERVWRALRDIPVGETISYTQLASRLGEPRAVRAVASACAANKIAVAIPCHRVVRTDGSLSGYRWGLERKQALIDREAGGA